MIKLYGIAASNYFSTVKVALLEKKIEFEEISQFPSQEAGILSESPMGKIPYIQIGDRYLSETNVIYDYLEDINNEFPLYPKDAFEKAKTKEIIRFVELYLDAPARRHLGAAVFGEEINQAALEEVKPAIEKGLNAITKLAKFDPYISGNDFTYADIASFFHLGFTNFHMKKIYQWDITDSHPEIGKYLEFVGQRNSINSVQSDLERMLLEIIDNN